MGAHKSPVRTADVPKHVRYCRSPVDVGTESYGSEMKPIMLGAAVGPIARWTNHELLWV